MKTTIYVVQCEGMYYACMDAFVYCRYINIVFDCHIAYLYVENTNGFMPKRNLSC